jgi:hypothetical protein
MVALVHLFCYEGVETTISPSAPDEVEVMLLSGAQPERPVVKQIRWAKYAHCSTKKPWNCSVR